MCRRNLLAYCLLGIFFGPTLAPVQAQVQVKTLADGTTVIYNEPVAARQRRQSSHLLAVPSTRLEALIDRYARLRGLSPRLVQAVIQVESGYNVRALSSKGAMGLMQLMPATARELRVGDPYDAEQNIKGGTLYLRQMLQRFSGDLTLALAAYNAGPTAVARYDGIPPYRETRNYVDKILSIYRGGRSAPLLLQDHARSVARKRDREAVRDAAAQRVGDPVFIARDKDGRLVMTTSPKSQ